ncbi:hypothetical protein SRABI83_00982 [Arthrobacter sp. Bi83]|uniref:hypothetical protein n=1 Tax=Arthrobacter sp. Bi83 TaxID=2822353 RepID=UPI001DF53244|nr:hypothetical protein [Arthrobacter sp. Bi83]CAH0162283.1 hypothetical protein SRABI83_00982 [Arthrobacter sp. Bi83]
MNKILAAAAVVALRKFRRRQHLAGGLRGRAPVPAALLAFSLLLTGCTVTSGPRTSTTTATLAPGAFSMLDDAGVEQIKASRTARLDMSSGTLEKAAVNVGVSENFGPEINTKGAGKIDLTIVGPAGEVTGKTDRIRFLSGETRADFSEVTYFLTAGSREEFYELIRDGVQRYGIAKESAEGWISSTESDPASKSDFSITSGFATGLEVNYDLRYNGAKGVQVIIVHVHPAA